MSAQPAGDPGRAAPPCWLIVHSHRVYRPAGNALTLPSVVEMVEREVGREVEETHVARINGYALTGTHAASARLG